MSNPGPAAPAAATAAPAAATAAPAAATAASKTKPANYIMGIYKESQPGEGDWYIVAGRKPKVNWSGINDTAPEPTLVPTQKRRFRS